jgi:hypothetical protein
MSKRKKTKLRPTRTAEPAVVTERKVATPKRSKIRIEPKPSSTEPLVFGKDTYRWFGGGFLLIVIGFLLMTGGRGDDPTIFDEEVIYSFRRITLAPLLILAGLGVTTYAIFKK